MGRKVLLFLIIWLRYLIGLLWGMCKEDLICWKFVGIVRRERILVDVRICGMCICDGFLFVCFFFIGCYNFKDVDCNLWLDIGVKGDIFGFCIRMNCFWDFS